VKSLKIREGVNQPPSINPDVFASGVKKRKKYSVNEYVKGIRDGNRAILSQAITLVESSLPDHKSAARSIIEKCLPESSTSVRIGITGVPGAGKSTFIETFGLYAVSRGRKVAVLAVDPSSERSKGSILGDKTRMENLSVHPNAFIRPSPSAGTLGGVARKTRETIVLCEAAGYNIIFIETVGVGQSETVVHSMVDFFLLLMLAGAGDELQGIKRGIIEMADALTINKADGNNVDKANMAKAQYKSALQLYPVSESGWKPRVLTCSAINNAGIPEIWQMITEYMSFTRNNSYFENNRIKQALYWMTQSIDDNLLSHFYQNEAIQQLIKAYQQKVLANEISSFVAAKHLIDHYFSHIVAK